MVTATGLKPVLLATNRMRAMTVPYDDDFTFFDWTLYFSPTEVGPVLLIRGGGSLEAASSFPVGGGNMTYAIYQALNRCWYDHLLAEEGELTFDRWEENSAVEQAGSFVADGSFELDLVDYDTDPEHPATVHFSGEFADVLFTPD